MEDIYYKQIKLFNPNKQSMKVFVYGAGSIGSHVTVSLAKIGVKDITVYDYDEVEQGNTPAQFFDRQSKGKKTEEIKRIVQQMTGTVINCIECKIDEKTDIKPEFNSIHIIAFDNIEGRKILFNKLKDFPVHIIDGRIGGFVYEKYYIKGQEDLETYAKTLEGEFSEQECGEKCLWVVNSLISSKIVTDVILISMDKKPNYLVKGTVLADQVILKGDING